MGILDRLEKITEGVIDVVTAPLALPYDLIRSIPDPNYNAGDAFSVNINRFTGGFSDIGEASGLFSVGRSVAEHTPIDDILGRTLVELDMYYSSGLQQAQGRLPAGLGTMSNWVNNIPGLDWQPQPGDISLQRGLGTIGGAAAAALPGGTPLWEGTVRAWREANQMSPGQIIANNYFSLWQLSPQEYQQATSTLGYNLLSGAFDAGFRWLAQPEVLVGKGIKVTRNRWNPTVNRMLDRFHAQTGMTAQPARPMVQSAASLPDLKPEVRSAVGSTLAQMTSDLDGNIRARLADALTEDLMVDARLVDGHLTFRTVDPDMSTERFRSLKAEMRAIDDHIPESLWTDIFGSDEMVDSIGAQVSSQLDDLIPEPTYGGAVNLQVDDEQGRTLLHVTRSSHYERIKSEGILKVPEGADKALESNKWRNTRRAELEAAMGDVNLPERFPDWDPMDPDIMADLDIAFDNLLNRVGALAEEGDEAAASIWQSLQKFSRDGGVDRADVDNLIKAIDMADNPRLREYIGFHLEAEINSLALEGLEGMSGGLRGSGARVAAVTGGAPPERAIYLLDESEMGEAMRYAAALRASNPADPPVILKIDADGLPVIYEDYMSPMTPDPRTGLPSDASLMTTVDRIGPDKVTEVLRPGARELDPASLSATLGEASPAYLTPGGRVHERLFNPNGSPIEPGDIARYDEIKEIHDTASHIYSTKGETEAIRYLKDAQAARARAGVTPDDPVSRILDHKTTQRVLNRMDGMSADEIRRVFFSDNPSGAVMADLLAGAQTYQERRLIYQALLGLDSPELHTIAPVADARIRALRRDLDDLKRGREYASRRKDLRHAAIDGSDYSNRVWMDDEEYDALETMVRGEIKEAQNQVEIGRFLETMQRQAPIETPLRVRRGALARERIRSSAWYQESSLARPIRSVTEKRPHQFINVHDPNADVQVVRQLEEARPLGIASDRVRHYREAYMGARNETDKIRILNEMDNEIIEAAARKAGLSKEEITQLVNRAQRGRGRTAQFLSSRKFSADDADVHTFYDADTGEMIQLNMPLLGTQLQNWVPMTDVRAVISQSSRIRRVRRRLGSVPTELMDSFYHLWKPSVLLRGGWPIRVVSDEQLRILARTGSLIRHMAAIELGELPRWSNIFAPGMSMPSRVAAAVGTVTTAPLSASTRVNRWVVKGARKLGLVDPQWYDDAASVGYEQLASSRAAFAGPNEAVNSEFQALIGHHEMGILDHLTSKGSGQWATVTPQDRTYGTSWTRVLNDQIGRDPLAQRILRAFRDSGDYALNQREALRTTMRAWLDEAGHAGLSRSQFDDFVDYIGDALDQGHIPQGASSQQWLDEVVQPFMDFHRITAWDDILEDVSIRLADDIENWRNGIYRSTARAGGHNGMRNAIKGGIRGLDDGVIRGSADDLDIFVDRLNAAYDAFEFGHPSAGINPANWDNFDDWLHEFVFENVASGYIHSDDPLRLIDDIAERIDNWVPEDPRVSMELQDPTAEIRTWLTTTPEGRAYGESLPWNYEDVPRWIDGVTGMLAYYTDDFNPGLVDDVLARKVDATSLERIETSRRPPTIHAEIVDQFLGRSAVTRSINDFLSTAFDTFGRLPTDTLSRQPLFRHLYANEMQRIRGTMARQGIEMTEEAIQDASTRARQYALHEVNRWLYNLAETSRFGEMMRGMTPFYSAWQEVLEVWAGLARRDPSVIGRGLLLWRAPNKAGLVTQDDEGNEYITFRFSEKMADKLPETDWVQYLAQGGVRFGKTSFNLILNSPLPGAGPPIQILANEIAKNKPSLEETLSFLLPFGVKSNSWEILMSPMIRRLNSNIGGVDGDRTYERDFMNIMVWMDWQYRTGQRTDPPTYSDVEDAAKKIFAIRSFATVSFPAQPIIDTPLKFYQDIYRQLIEDYGSEMADEVFLNEYGNEFFAVTLSRTVSQSGIPPTVDAHEAAQHFSELIAKYPGYGRLIIGDDAAMGEFSSAAFAYQLTNPLDPNNPFAEPDRQYRELTLDPETGTIEEVDRRLGWIEYIEAMDQIDLVRRSRGLPNLRVKDAEDLSNLKRAITQKIAQEYPEWWRDFNERDDLKWNETIESLSAIAFDPMMEDRPDLAGVVDYMEARQLILGELNRRKQLGGSATLDATSNQDLASVWAAIVNSIIEDNVAFGPIYYRYLEGDPVNLKVTTP